MSLARRTLFTGMAALCLAGRAEAAEPPEAAAFLADARPAAELTSQELLKRIMSAKLLSMTPGISPEGRAEIERRRMEAVVAYQEKVAAEE